MSANENVNLISEDELYGLFERRRPERESFEAGIEERIRERQAARREEETEEPAQSTFWRRVAAVLPIDLAGGLVAGSKLAPSVGGKAFSTALALPVLLLGAAIGGFFAATGQLRKSTRDAAPIDEEVRASLQRQKSKDAGVQMGGTLAGVVQSGALIAFLVTWLFGNTLAVDLLLALLVVSMASLVISVRAFARLGALDRESVTRLATANLIAVFTGCFLWFQNLGIADVTSGLGIGAAASVILLGVPICYVAGGARRKALLALGVGVFLTVLLNLLGATRTSHGSLRSQLVGLKLDTADLSRWEEASAIHDALVAVGAQVPDLAHVRERVAEAIRAEDDVHPVVWTAAHRMGLVSDRDWKSLSDQHMEAHRLDRIQEHGSYNATDYFEYLFPMLVATRELTREQRETIADEILKEWPRIGEHGALVDARGCVRALEVLGREDLINELRDDASALLEAHWISGKGFRLFSNVGGFTPNPEKFRTSFEDDTLAGVELMARFGVPESIDLQAVHGYLRSESRGYPLFVEWMPYLNALPRAALLRLREEIGFPERTWSEVAIGERLLLGTILIVLLCIAAIRMTPANPDVEKLTGAGAQP